MGPQTLIDRLLELIARYAFAIFLKASRMKEQEYFQLIVEMYGEQNDR